MEAHVEVADQALASAEQALRLLSIAGPVAGPSAGSAAGGRDQVAYQRGHVAYESTIRQAMEHREDMGGVEATNLLQAAERHAAAGRWADALRSLEQAREKALAVIARAPWVKLYTTEKPLIEGSARIKQVVPDDKLFDGTPKASAGTYGKQVEAGWSAAKELAKNKDYAGAAAKGKALVTYIKRIVLKDDALVRAREEMERTEERLKAEMAAAMAESPRNPDVVRSLALRELKRSDDALALGLDPAIEMSRPLDEEDDEHTIKTCEAWFKQHDWFQIKHQFHEGELDAADMKNLWKFRQGYVAKLIDKQRKKYPSLIAKAAGSTDLESDIDITYATPRSGDDVKAAREFNDEVQRTFGKPPGRAFDVNIYIREYGDIKETFNEFHGLEANEDTNLANLTESEGDLFRLTQVDQDVATLIKQRRFLTQEAFDAMLRNVIGALPEAAQAQAMRQYEEAEDVYFLTLKEKIDGIERRIDEKLAAGVSPEERSALEAAKRQIQGLSAIEDPALYQRTIQQTMATLEHSYPAIVMETTDAMYLDRMAVLRENEQKVRDLEASGAADPSADHDGEPCSQVHPSESDHAKWKKLKIDALKVQIKKDITTNIMFANEAYISQGAITHVVETNQARDKTPEEKQRIIAALPANMLVQSTNEQLADFFKDMEHSQAEVARLREEGDDAAARLAEGEAYVHSSKYLVRLLDAAWALAARYEGQTPAFELPWFGRIGDGEKLTGKIEAMKKRIDGLLLKLRKSSTVPSDVKNEVAIGEIQAMFTIDNIAAFNAKFQELGQQINAAVRQRADFQEGQRVDRQATADFMGQREESPREQAVKTLLGVANKPLDLGRKAAFSEAMRAIGGADPEAVVDGWSEAAAALNELGDGDVTLETVEAAVGAFRVAAQAVTDPEIRQALLKLHAALDQRLQVASIAADSPETHGGLQRDIDAAAAAQSEASACLSTAAQSAITGWQQTAPEAGDKAEMLAVIAAALAGLNASIAALSGYRGIPAELSVEFTRQVQVMTNMRTRLAAREVVVRAITTR